jgi:nucleotide-binding universal stress UspA family protein
VYQNPYADPPATPRVGAATAVVLVGFDGSGTAWGALSWACGEARRLRGRAVAVFVSSSVGHGIAAAGFLFVGCATMDYAGVDIGGTERAEALRHELECYAADHDVDLAFVHADGDAACELLRLARVLHADQIVVGQSMKARHHLAGSLGRRIVGKRDAPVVVVVP